MLPRETRRSEKDSVVSATVSVIFGRPMIYSLNRNKANGPKTRLERPTADLQGGRKHKCYHTSCVPCVA